MSIQVFLVYHSTMPEDVEVKSIHSTIDGARKAAEKLRSERVEEYGGQLASMEQDENTLKPEWEQIAGDGPEVVEYWRFVVSQVNLQRLNLSSGMSLCDMWIERRPLE